MPLPLALFRLSRVAAAIAAAAYVALVWLQGAGSALPGRLLPAPALYFVQVAALFTNRATVVVDYRTEAWLCEQRRWVEMDVRRYFGINRDDKENRFHRTLHFFGGHRQTLQALESFLVDRSVGDAGLGFPAGTVVGGVRFIRLRQPIPPVGGAPTRWRPAPLAGHPEEQQRRLYWTPRSRRAQRCGGLPPLASEDA
jgi:hypothetical protein